MGKRASRVKAEEAMSYVFGYTNFIDGSAAGSRPRQYLLQMKCGHLRTMGPVISPPTRCPIPQPPGPSLGERPS